MLKIFLSVAILVMASQAAALEPFFYGDWDSDIDAVKKMETRELISFEEASLKDFPNFAILKYKASATENEDIAISYIFNDNKLALVTWILNLQNINSTDAKALLEDYKTQIINKLNNVSIIEKSKVSDNGNVMRATFVKEKNSMVSIFSHYSTYESKLWCNIDFADVNNPWNTGMLNSFNNLFTKYSDEIKTIN